MIKNKDCRISPGKSLNKQQQQTATKTNSEDGKGGNKIVSYHSILNIQFLTKSYDTQRNRYSEKQQSIEIILEGAQMLDLLGKAFKSI